MFENANHTTTILSITALILFIGWTIIAIRRAKNEKSGIRKDLDHFGIKTLVMMHLFSSFLGATFCTAFFDIIDGVKIFSIKSLESFLIILIIFLGMDMISVLTALYYKNKKEV